ncbi:MAG TPA: oxygen-independent coproporphyrinogen III oxidase [Candidatus Sulfotelmatobacter sp.]|jgi:oxygen-independent coproporphyrinogen-3 oxidase|nr:oxygen-independent coproporphyrinogen III oxidase [Candidatus Sulfotelmatobacter sp.]
MTATPRITVDLLRKYDRPGPRYTSYPTAVEFASTFGPAQYVSRLEEADRTEAPLSLYTHLPFCEHRCTFCGCHVVITQDPAVVTRYLGYLHREIDMLAAHLPHRRRVSQYHWGGGTPTHLTPAEMESLHARMTRHFTIEPDAEVAVEVDPRHTSLEQIELLRAMGFNRLSMGVQDFDPEVQAAVDRNQTEAQTRTMYDAVRARGFGSINIDLIYGLPLQTTARFSRTVDTVIAMRPDRVALYSYAHVPWIRAQQKWIEPKDLPSPEDKLALFVDARDRFLAGGYVEIGMDHFALPGDELAVARDKRRLHRNFMGYTVRMGSDMVAVGISGIGDVRGAFAQNEKKLSRYYEILDSGRFPVERGYALDADDRIRRETITRLMCNLWLDTGEIEREFSIDFASYFAAELAELTRPDGPVEHGFVAVEPGHLEVTGLGRFFVRNVAMSFDRYLKSRSGDKPVFSRTV